MYPNWANKRKTNISKHHNENENDAQASMPINPNRSLKVLVLNATECKPFYPTWLTLAFYIAIFIYFSYIRPLCNHPQ